MELVHEIIFFGFFDVQTLEKMSHKYHQINQYRTIHKRYAAVPSTNTSKYKYKIKKKQWFGPLQLCLRTHVLHFFKIMSNTLMMFVTHFFYSLNVKESKKNYFVHQFHRITPQNTSTKSKKLWFGHFFHGNNVKNSTKKKSWHTAIFTNQFFFYSEIIMDFCCINYQG